MADEMTKIGASRSLTPVHSLTPLPLYSLTPLPLSEGEGSIMLCGCFC